jgi:hypothetical protein
MLTTCMPDVLAMAFGVLGVERFVDVRAILTRHVHRILTHPRKPFDLKLELEGIVAKEAGSIYTAGRSTRWLKIKTDVGAERERKRRPRE